ncbi:SPOR domain-containing protein [Cellulophaga omnivescoria]|uniref:SPOR domain-containing protein n=1 Tax=Cellulophaga omnivescoria TaxID=1888890 RepID=UPI000985A256|nr:SPOR domain-containing protein [Cellulophaga omnivescoria]WBU88867.1 SPOR domain-containing protein [Cellulophaga omnivescoria]WKB80839.1 SPOR domain-containing protein [Cellulophaga lytica]
MPFIEEVDLLELHKDIDKAQLMNERLLDQIKFKNKELKRKKRQRNVLGIIAAVFFLGTLVFTSFSAGLSTRARAFNSAENNNILVSIDSLDVIKARINNLKEQNEELNFVNDFYLARNILEKKVIYSVQVKTFVDNNVTLVSNSLANTLFVKNNPFYTYSIGNFETIEEARTFRLQLVKMGFEDAFVASYKDGKRLKIENPN